MVHTFIQHTIIFFFKAPKAESTSVKKQNEKKNKTEKHMVMPVHEDCSNMNPEHSQGGGTQLHMWFADMHAYTLDLRY